MNFWKNGDPNDVSEEARKERSYLWMARVFCLICVVTLITDFILYGALSSLKPLIRVQPFYITTQDKDKQIVQIVRPGPATLNSEILQESFIRQYLVARFGIGTDVDELERRWGPDGTIQWMSSDSVFSTFLRDDAMGLTQQAREAGLTRDVEILNVRRIPRADGQIFWQAEVRLSDMSRSSPVPLVTDWLVNLGIVLGRFRVGLSWDQRLKNPLGFVVENFSKKILGTTAKGETK